MTLTGHWATKCVSSVDQPIHPIQIEVTRPRRLITIILSGTCELSGGVMSTFLLSIVAGRQQDCLCQEETQAETLQR